MNHPQAELYASDLTEAIWRKASASGAEHDCVEIADLPGGARAVRDSKQPNRKPLYFSASEWVAFQRSIIVGEL
ncbi:hypothetical protein GCM10010145_37850 [Streptomyces ruber]|uniref:DUF397 domain-containing protein n=2 Tax=Streptomyces TaxID=1883 RepID=A0A918EUM3_9ACTN|nr:DUF397 domain-containing protein [Streptomyces ruber]GGQ64432.1 hypothetical protein GCM10010145_37850 [Streptomyces ruber]